MKAPRRPATPTSEAFLAAANALDVVRLDGAPPVAEALETIAGALEARALTCRVAPTLEGYVCDEVNTSGWMEPTALASEVERFARSAHRPFPAYDPLRPEESQRNQVRVFPAGSFFGLELEQLNRKIGIHGCEQMRVLVCEGPVLLTWIGACRAEPFRAHERRGLLSLVPALKRRLALHRQLGAPGLATPAVTVHGIPAAPRASTPPAWLSGRAADRLS